jgi:hypothetical protein
MLRHAKWLSQQTARGISGKLPLVPTVALDSSKIRINHRGDMRLRVLLPDKSERIIGIAIGSLAAPIHSDDFRTIHIAPTGIEIRTSHGEVLPSRIESNRDEYVIASNGPTISMSQLRRILTDDAQDLFKICEYLNNNTSGASATSTRLSSTTGKPIPKRVPAGLASIRPLAVDDALWLLDQFLDEYFPHGGDIWLGDREHFPTGSDDVDRFTK